MIDITIRELQKQVYNWAKQFKKPYFSPLSQMAAMIEEVGEVARVMNRIYGDKPAKGTDEIKNLGEELADLIFSTVCMANSQNIDLTKALENKFEKVNIRDSSRWKKTKYIF